MSPALAVADGSLVLVVVNSIAVAVADVINTSTVSATVADAAAAAVGSFVAGIAAIALTVWVLAETISRRAWVGLVAIPATFCVGVSCGLPLYLFLRPRPSM